MLLPSVMEALKPTAPTPPSLKGALEPLTWRKRELPPPPPPPCRTNWTRLVSPPVLIGHVIGHLEEEGGAQEREDTERHRAEPRHHRRRDLRPKTLRPARHSRAVRSTPPGRGPPASGGRAARLGRNADATWARQAGVRGHDKPPVGPRAGNRTISMLGAPRVRCVPCEVAEGLAYGSGGGAAVGGGR